MLRDVEVGEVINPLIWRGVLVEVYIQSLQRRRKNVFPSSSTSSSFNVQEYVSYAVESNRRTGRQAGRHGVRWILISGLSI